jgi:RHS repeat-associated protein
VNLDFFMAPRSRGAILSSFNWSENRRAGHWHFKIVKRPNPNGGNYFTIENKTIGKTWYSYDNVNYQDVSLADDGIATLQRFSGSGGWYYLYTASDGTTTRFQVTADGSNAQAEEIRRPDGVTYTFSYDASAVLVRVSSNTGYQLILEHLASPNTAYVSKVCVLNAATTTPPVSAVCPSGARSVSYTFSGTRVASITDPTSAVWTISNTYSGSSTPFTESFYKPGVSGAYLTNSYGVDMLTGLYLHVTQQTYADGRTIANFCDYTGMGEAPNGIAFLCTGWSENSAAITYYGWGVFQENLTVRPAITPGPTTVTDPLMRVTQYAYDGAFTRVDSVTQPSGLKAAYSYNIYSSVSQKQLIPPASSGDPTLTTSWTYDCTYLVNCKKPATATDARGAVTNYTYDSTHGGLLTETLPAATSGAPRPQKRYTWSQFYAWYRNTSGTLVQATVPVWLVTQISECRTSSSCAGLAEETRTTFTYGTSGTANNLLLTQKTVQAGDGSVSATTIYTYDANGDKLSEDGPLAGSADTTVWKYDVMRRVTGVIAPDPDGGGALKYRATRNTYDSAGRLIRVERGTTLGQSDTDFVSFVSLESVESDYDALDRKIKETKKGGGTAYAVTQYSYDLYGRPECTAVRMNTAAFGSLPSSACTLGTEGGQGPDRITRRYYNAAGELTQVQVAVGTTDAAYDVTNTYTSNGKLATVTDGENNKTTYEYDGLDRLRNTRYPVPTQGQATSSTTDYEQLGYDANSNVTSQRRRDGQMIYSTYDALNRVTLKDLPSAEVDVSYAYDLQSHLLSATQGSTVTSQGWDALGRMTSETNASSTTSLQYDAAGRLTRVTHSDGFYVTYNYNTSDLTSIAEYGTTTLVSYGYDDLGRRTSLSRANGATTSYGYDAISRLSSFSQDLAGTTYDLSVSSIGYNPAAQIVSLTRSNDAYAWGSHYNVNRGYGVNGLNQLTTAGSASLGYDGRGNLTANGSNAYTYTVENRLISGPGGVSISYDPMGRIGQLTQGGSTTKFEHLGPRMILERNGSGTILRRYVHGPGDDEPVVWYEGSGTTDRRFLQTDERGSVIAVTNSAGSLLAANTYDEYGIPGASNLGRFQYTGQAWLSEISLAYYKARMYDPKLGRFMQTDPTGYDDGPNWYAYVADDPLNNTDPSGLDICTGSHIASKDGQPCFGGGASIQSTGRQPGEPKNPVFLLTLSRAGDAAEAVSYALFSAAFGWIDCGSDAGACRSWAGSTLLGAVTGGAGKFAKPLLSEAVQLSKQLASAEGVAELLNGGGRLIGGAGTSKPIRDVARLVSEHGGRAEDWVKVTSTAPGRIQTHAYKNVVTGEVVELKSMVK